VITPTTPERRDLSDEGQKRRLQEKTIFNCLKCYPKLCRCENRKQHGVRFDE
jgi:hypothetical protein